MPEITPLQAEVRGLTGRQIEVEDMRTVPYNSWGTLLEIPIEPADECDLLVIGHIVAWQVGQQRAREAVIDIRVMLDDTRIGEGRAVQGVGTDNGDAHQSSGILASARDVPAGAHMIRVQGRASSTTGVPTLRANTVSVGVVEFYR